MFVGINGIRISVGLTARKGFLQEAFCSNFVSLSGEVKVNRVTKPINSPVKVDPSSRNLYIGFIDLPAMTELIPIIPC